MTILYSESTAVIFPDEMKDFNKETLGEKKDQFKITGIIGDPSKPNGEVKLTVKSGKLAIQNENKSF